MENCAYCDVSSLGCHISVIIASNMMPITFSQTSKIVDLIFNFIIAFHIEATFETNDENTDSTMPYFQLETYDKYNNNNNNII